MPEKLRQENMYEVTHRTQPPIKKSPSIKSEITFREIDRSEVTFDGSPDVQSQPDSSGPERFVKTRSFIGRVASKFSFKVESGGGGTLDASTVSTTEGNFEDISSSPKSRDLILSGSPDETVRTPLKPRELILPGASFDVMPQSEKPWYLNGQNDMYPDGNQQTAHSAHARLFPVPPVPEVHPDHQ